MVVRVGGGDWDDTEAEEYRGSAGFLDGQRLRAAQLHQAGPGLEPRDAGRPGHPGPSGSDGFQVSPPVHELMLLFPLKSCKIYDHASFTDGRWTVV